MPDPKLSTEARVRALVELAAQTDDAIVDGDVLRHLIDALALDPELERDVDDLAQIVRRWYLDTDATADEIERLRAEIAAGYSDLIARASA